MRPSRAGGPAEAHWRQPKPNLCQPGTGLALWSVAGFDGAFVLYARMLCPMVDTKAVSKPPALQRFRPLPKSGRMELKDHLG